MDSKFKTKTISIEVIPEVAVLTLGLLKGLLPNIVPMIEGLYADGPEGDMSEILDAKKMRAVLDEIYDKCSKHSRVKIENTPENHVPEIVN